MNPSPLISVIVPVYNVEAYLDQCLESIVNQSYRHLEILVIDDGSTDNGGTMCDHWAERDERIRVIHQPNGGLSAARNTGLDAMSGQLVMMVDSDDVLHASAISTLLDLMSTHQADIAVGGYLPFTGAAPQWLDRGESAQIHDYGQQEAILAIFYQQGLDHSAWGRLYRASLFDEIRYPVGLYYEDLAIIYPLLLKCTRVARTSQPLYGYRQRENSILDKFSPKRADVLNIAEGLERQVLQQGEFTYLKAVRSRLLSAYFNILLLSSQDRNTRHDDLGDRCWNGIKRLRAACLADPSVRLKNKIGIVASYLSRGVLCKIIGRNYRPRP